MELTCKVKQGRRGEIQQGGPEKMGHLGCQVMDTLHLEVVHIPTALTL